VLLPGFVLLTLCFASFVTTLSGWCWTTSLMRLALHPRAVRNLTFYVDRAGHTGEMRGRIRASPTTTIETMTRPILFTAPLGACPIAAGLVPRDISNWTQPTGGPRRTTAPALLPPEPGPFGRLYYLRNHGRSSGHAGAGVVHSAWPRFFNCGNPQPLTFGCVRRHLVCGTPKMIAVFEGCPWMPSVVAGWHRFFQQRVGSVSSR
jgi:hypothetical protein